MTAQQIVMYLIGAALIYVGIKKQYEPALLIPMGFGAILVNIPMSGVINQELANIGSVTGIIQWLYKIGIEASEALPILLFIGIGSMIDFEPLLKRPVLFIFGLASQIGIAIAFLIALLIGFSPNNAASIGIIGAADGPTAILVSQILKSDYIGPIAVVSYSYMSLVPIIQPVTIRAITTKEERKMVMNDCGRKVSKTEKIIFPILATFISGLIAPMSVSMVGFLMFGNLIKECGVLDNLSKTAKEEFSNIITLILGLTISFGLKAELFVRKETVVIMVIGLLAFVFDTIGGVAIAKIMNLFLRNKINPMIGAAGISAFPMSSRVVQKMAQEELPGNVILMHATGANVAGQIFSAIIGGYSISLIS